MTYTVRISLLGTALILALGVGVSIVTSAVVASRAYQARGEQVAQHDRAITVKGSARKSIRSDLAVWRITVRAEHAELKEAFAVLNGGIAKVRAFLESKGFKNDEIGLAAIATETLYEHDKEGNATNTITGYRLERMLGVTTPDVDRVNQTAGEVTQLIEEGIFVVSLPPEYHYTKLADLKVAMMGEASKDARARAEEIAQNAGCNVAEVRSAQMGVLQITRPHSTDVSSYGIYDTSTIDKDIQAVVTLTFGVRSR